MRISKFGMIAVIVPGGLWAGVGVHVAAEAVNGAGALGGRGFLALLVGAAVATLAAAVLSVSHTRSTSVREQSEAMRELADALRSHSGTEARWEERMYRAAARAGMDAADHNARFPQGNSPIPADTGPFPSLGPFLGN
jgi:hypothetical protein